MEPYKDHPARKRAQAAAKAKNLPKAIDEWCNRIPAEEKAKYPIDQSDGGEDDEQAETWRLRDLRGRVKAARATVSRTPGLEELLIGDWRKAALFYARFEITESQFRDGVPAPRGIT